MLEQVIGEFFDANVFVFGDAKQCVIFDAGADVSKVQAAVGTREVLGVFLTHGHVDHCAFVEDYQKAFSCKIYASEKAKQYLQDGVLNYSEGQWAIEDFENFCFLSGEESLVFGQMKINYFALGGHTFGDMAFLCDEHLFVGDVLIGRSIGRTDLFGGSDETMAESLEKLKSTDYKKMCCGHGEVCDKAAQDKVCSVWLSYLRKK